MSLDRKDVRSKLDPDMKSGLELLCEIDGVTELQFIEAVLVPVIRKRIHDATVISAKATLLGLTGNRRENSGTTGNSGEDEGRRGGRR